MEAKGPVRQRQAEKHSRPRGLHCNEGHGKRLLDSRGNLLVPSAASRGTPMIRPPVLVLLSTLFLLLSVSLHAKVPEGRIRIANFGRTNAGEPVYRYTLINQKGFEAVVISYGAALQSLKTPGRDGETADIVLGYDTVGGYEKDKSYFGATIGRYGNRIAGGQFRLDGTVVDTPKNDGPNTLHGGTIGFNKRVWIGTDRSRADAQVLELAYTSTDGEEGFPGALEVRLTYTLPREKNELRIDYWASTDKDTAVNLTNRSYFNLSGLPDQEILDHVLVLHASKFTPVDSTLVPTGELREVAGTPFDFSKRTAMGARITQDDEQLKFGRGYDHNWVLEAAARPGEPRLAAEVFEPHYAHRTGFCLETQHFPDSPNHANFPSTLLKPGETYRSTTVLRFLTRN
jgi:aldose 1-epimerase